MEDKKNSTRYRTMKIVGIICIAIIVLQAIRPPLENPPVEADFKGPIEVAAIFRKSCYDCHSNETKLKWFDYLQPAYSKVVRDISAGREGLNFSKWGLLDPGDQKGKLFEILNQIELGSMPPGQYLKLHHRARISPGELDVLKQYVAGLIDNNIADSSLISDAETQFRQWVLSSARAEAVPTTITGVPYYPDYRHWQVINITDRLDNNSLRIIFGNAVAIKAARESNTNPWPQGTVLAKVMWDRIKAADGRVSTGSFKQVEFMIKDEKYAATAGWGWARFKTVKLLAYGKNAGYATECVNCHTPVKGNDFVFTKPVKF